MTYDEAMSACENGRPVKRPGWGAFRLEWDAKEKLARVYTEPKNPLIEAIPYKPKAGDKNAKDWVVVS